VVVASAVTVAVGGRFRKQQTGTVEFRKEGLKKLLVTRQSDAKAICKKQLVNS
jgi:predicted RNA-binding protein